MSKFVMHDDKNDNDVTMTDEDTSDRRQTWRSALDEGRNKCINAMAVAAAARTNLGLEIQATKLLEASTVFACDESANNPVDTSRPPSFNEACTQARTYVAEDGRRVDARPLRNIKHLYITARDTHRGLDKVLQSIERMVADPKPFNDNFKRDNRKAWDALRREIHLAQRLMPQISKTAINNTARIRRALQIE
jgi:hypothetical protein